MKSKRPTKSKRKWTAEDVEKLLLLLSCILTREVPLEKPNRELDDDEVHYVCDDVNVNSGHPDWQKATQLAADLAAKLDIERTSKLRVPEAEPYQLTDAEWEFVLGYFESSDTPKSAAVRKRFQRVMRKLGKHLLFFAVYAYPPRASRNS